MSEIEITITKKELNAFEKRLDNQVDRLGNETKAETLITAQEVVKGARGVLDRGNHNVTKKLRGSLRQRDVSRNLGREKGSARTVTGRGSKGNHLHFLVRGTGNRHNGIRNTGAVRNTVDFLSMAEQQAESRYNTMIKKIVEKKREF